MTITKTAVLPVSPDEAFTLITEPERLRRWQTVSAYVDLRAGGEYRWTVTPGHVVSGTFREVEPGRRIVFGWGWEGAADVSTVTVTVEPTDGGTLVTLVHEGLTGVSEEMHAEGWDHYFERLERLAVKGEAGPDEWAWAPENLDPVVASEAALAAIQPVLRGLTQADRPKPTPCADFSCHELTEHLMTSMVGLGAMADTSVSEPTDHAGLEDKVSRMAAEAIEGWRKVDLNGTVRHPSGNDMPAGLAAGILPVEILLHGWDLAQASGQELKVSDEVVGFIRTLSEGLIPGGRGSSFADEVTPAEGASSMEQFAAYAGRTPMAA
jgi:uncharacterized protein (TIGR03086 family)